VSRGRQPSVYGRSPDILVSSWPVRELSAVLRREATNSRGPGGRSPLGRVRGEAPRGSGEFAAPHSSVSLSIYTRTRVSVLLRT
jgi:hypothetical protein